MLVPRARSLSGEDGVGEDDGDDVRWRCFALRSGSTPWSNGVRGICSGREGIARAGAEVALRNAVADRST